MLRMLNAHMAPQQERERLDLENRLQGQGRLGVRTDMFGGTSEQLSMAKAQAEAVLSDGISRALDPMCAADRRVAHNAVSDIEGVETISEGSNMDRRVVIQLAE